MQVLAIGEILWDVFETGEHPGGAPFNFAAHCARLGHDAYLLSAVGDDERGVKLLEAAQARGVQVGYVSTTAQAATGLAYVRGDGFEIVRPAAYDFLEASEKLLSESFDAIYFGSLLSTFEPARRALYHVLKAFPDAWHFFDVNLRPPHYTLEIVNQLFCLANVVKLNEPEARLLCVDNRAMNWEALAITRGERGCSLWTAEGHFDSPAVPVAVKDTVGAGDAFAAALLHGLAERWAPDRVAEFANRQGALVASNQGATLSHNL